MTKSTDEGSAEAKTPQGPEARSRWGKGAIAGAGAGALGLAALVAALVWPGGDSETSPDPSPSASAERRDLPWGEPIPWDEVGPGWSLLAYDAVPEETAWGEDWSLAGDELWLAAPDGTLYFGADVSGLGASYVEAWTGREAWLFQVTDYQGESSTGTLWTVDLTDGTAAIVGEDSPPRGSYETTAVEGVYLTESGCCGCTETTAHYPDGTTHALGNGCSETVLSPDGRTLAYLREFALDGTFGNDAMVSDLEGDAIIAGESLGIDAYSQILWLDEGTLLLYQTEKPDRPPYFALDVASGAATPWPGAQPEEFYLDFWGHYPGSWLLWNRYGSDMVTRITDEDGTPMLDLACDYPSCWPTTTGDLVLWEESDIEYVDGVRMGDDFQRLTLVDPATGERTPFIEFTRVDGHITTVLPHPPVYG